MRHWKCCSSKSSETWIWMRTSLLGFRAPSPSRCMNLLTRKLSGMSQSTLSTHCWPQRKESAAGRNELSLGWQPCEEEAEKTEKYGPLRWEVTRRYPGYRIVQLNVIMDVLGGWSQDLEAEMKKIFRLRSLDILKRMQKAVLSGSLNIARMFKVIAKWTHINPRQYQSKTIDIYPRGNAYIKDFLFIYLFIFSFLLFLFSYLLSLILGLK